MVAWETITLADQPPFIQDFAEIWRAADKIVYSTTLETVSSARTRIERDFDPEAGTYLEPFALRALGAVREDELLIEQAINRFDAMGLRWHAEQSRKALAATARGLP